MTTCHTQLTASVTPIDVCMIVIGDEILNGRTIDANAAWCAKFLASKGLNFKQCFIIRDDEKTMKETIEAATKIADVVITSGGVGPTLDDLTKKVLADYFSKPIEENSYVAQVVQENYQRFQREWNPQLNFYHHFPRDFSPIKNPLGLAPGLQYYDQKSKTLIISAPGVPKEFKAMLDSECLLEIERHFSDRFVALEKFVVRTSGIPEEKIFNELCPQLWNDLSQFGKVSSLPHIIGIDIVVSMTFPKYQEPLVLKKKMEIQKIIESSALAPYVWNYGQTELSRLVLDRAMSKKLTFSFAESCTGGLASSKITDLAGSSAVFTGSIISYANEVKINQLNVKAETINKFGAVSLECALEMARGVYELTSSDVGISITGIAGPQGGSTEKPVGTVFIAYCHKKGIKAFKFHLPGDRQKLKDRFSEMALYILWKELESL